MLFLLAETEVAQSVQSQGFEYLMQHGPSVVAFLTSLIVFVRYLVRLDNKIRVTRAQVTQQYLEELQKCQASFMCEISNLHIEHQSVVRDLCDKFTDCNNKALSALENNTNMTKILAGQVERLTEAIKNMQPPTFGIGGA